MKTNERDSGAGVRLMRQLIDELRAERPPELDWTAMEQRLAARIAPMAAVRRARGAHGLGVPFARISGFAAAAAAVALLVGQADEGRSAARDEGTRPAAGEQQEPAAAAPSDPAMRVGAVLESGEQGLRVSVAGVAEWELAPASRAIVRRTSSPYVIELERGSVVAEVVAQHVDQGLVESFAVDVGLTRVAVHGTMFSVTRQDDAVRVDVARGSVTIGPAGGRGLTTGRLLVAPAAAEFSLDGGLARARLLPEPMRMASLASVAASPNGVAALPAKRNATAERPTLAEPASAPGWREDAAGGAGARSEGPSAVEEPAETPAEPTESPAPSAPWSIAQAKATMAGCLAVRETSDGDSSLRVSIATRVTLHLDEAHQVRSIRFVPPLAPATQQRCASTLFGRTLDVAGPMAEFSVSVSSD